MNEQQKTRYESQVDVRAFYTAQPVIFNGSAGGRKLMEEHDGLVTKLDGFLVAESSGDTAAQEGTASRAEQRDTVRGLVEAVSRSSRFLPIDVEGVSDRFPIPRRASDRQLLSDSKSALQNALPLRAAFEEHGLPANVLTDLPVQIEAFEKALDKERSGKAARLGSNAAVDKLLARASKITKALDVIFRNGPKQDADIVALWRAAKRVGPRRVKKPAPPAAPAAPSADKVA